MLLVCGWQARPPVCFAINRMLRAVFSHLLIPASLVVEPCDFVATLGITHTLFRVRRAQSQISRARDYGLSRPCAMYTCESRTTVAQSGRASRFCRRGYHHRNCMCDDCDRIPAHEANVTGAPRGLHCRPRRAWFRACSSRILTSAGSLGA
jgi:hypothetical protein